MRQIAWAIVALGLVSTPALAQETTGSLGLMKQGRTLLFAPTTLAAAQTPPAAADEPSKITVIVGSDFPSDYIWRGFVQETEGFIAQPFVDVGIAATDKVSVNFGMWDSIHSSEFTGKFYEADYYGQVTFTSGKWKPAVLFTSYTSPNDSFETVNELAGIVSYDDSGSEFPLAPKFIIGFGLDEGNPTYFEAGITPSIAAGSATFWIPVKLGLSLNDFYAQTFGYFQVGAKIGASIPTSGAFAAEVHGGVDIIVPGEGNRWDKKAEPVFNVGISLTFN